MDGSKCSQEDDRNAGKEKRENGDQAGGCFGDSFGFHVRFNLSINPELRSKLAIASNGFRRRIVSGLNIG